jgi:hypothetical protein
VSWLLLPHKAPDADPITPDQLLGKKVRSSGKDFANEEARARAFVAALSTKSKRKSRVRSCRDVE